jgi:hypothetical protein
MQLISLHGYRKVAIVKKLSEIMNHSRHNSLENTCIYIMF